MTIRDLVYDVECQGNVCVKKIVERENDYDIVVVCEFDCQLYESKELTPYLDYEVSYIYANSANQLCIEFRVSE